MGWYEDRHSLKQAREQLGLSQRALSEVAGIPKWVLADFESGRRQDEDGTETSGNLGRNSEQLEINREAAIPRGARTGRVYLSRLLHTPPREGERLTGYRAFREYQEKFEANQQKAAPERVAYLEGVIKIKDEIDKILREIIENQKEHIAELQKELSREGSEKDARISELEAQVKDLRELYEAGTAAELARERYEQLHEKVLAATPKAELPVK